MSEWINEAKEREDKLRLSNEAREHIRIEETQRIKIAFPEWRSLLYGALQNVCKSLAKAFPGSLERQYSVSPTPDGYAIRCQGFPDITLKIEFQLETLTMT